MKKLILLFSIIFSFFSLTINAQLAFSKNPTRSSKKISKKEYATFKNSTTIFILPEVYSKETYKQILSKAWKVTPFKIVNHNEFNFKNYINGNYSFIDIHGYKVSYVNSSGIASNSFYLHFSAQLRVTFPDKIKTKIEKAKSQHKEIDYAKIFYKHSHTPAMFYLRPTADFVQEILNNNVDNIVESMYSKPVFHNFKPGFLQNYFQKMSSILETRDSYYLYEDEANPILSELAKQELVLPKTIGVKFNKWNASENKQPDEYTQKLLKNYSYKYNIQTEEEISNRILAGEDFYYFRYASMNTDRFIQVINSKTGDVVYRHYAPLGYNLKSKHFKAIGKAIKKAVKRKNK